MDPGGHATPHRFDLLLIILTGVAVFITGNLGARVSLKIGTKMVKAGLGLIMWVFAAQLVVKPSG